MSTPELKTAALALVIAAASIGSAGCSKAPAPSGSGGAGGSKASVHRRTTSGEIAVRNLSDRIATLERRVSGSNADLETRTRLVDLLLTRAQFLGTFTDFARVGAIAAAASRDFPEQGAAHLLEARALSAVHRFTEAKAALARAEALGADTALALASVHVAEGRELPRALALVEQRATAAPTLEHLTSWANAEAALGRFERADEHYRAALDSYRDVSPFPVAYVLFQRGVMWAEMAAAPERALPLYLEAVERVPVYVVANVHLAELEAESGKKSLAIARLRRLADTTSDPEPVGYLGELLVADDPRDPAAEPLIARARARYDELLALHRAAFLDHAAEFFAGPGADPARALALARENLALRQTPRAHALAIQTARAARDVSLACQLLDGARAAASQSQNLRHLLQTEGKRCSELR